MESYGNTECWDRVEDYDGLGWATAQDADEAAGFLAELAGRGRALELGVGSGRVAVPLARRGVEVVGIDSSEPMADQLRRKPDAADIEVVIGDFAEVPVPGTFGVVYCVLNTFMLLLTQDEQVRCFENVAARLDPGGSFVLQLSLLSPAHYAQSTFAETMHAAADSAVLIAAEHDRAGQRVNRQQMVVTKTGVQFYPMSYRYVWPSELDLMARIAGLELAGRWAGWTGAPYQGNPGRYITVFRKSV
ncbi:class I SAM-dependent methyltransferase [Streptomyces sp. NPDC048644]|uniref:class I SAM-dependent methyltransferase n=1 Tax=Streptomyces sp. NPDC048644 TaxID=3365582 RepID=UPI003716E112